MELQNSFVFHTSTEVSIFSQKEIVGALAENINNKIPCQNMAGDFCFISGVIDYLVTAKNIVWVIVFGG